jgi:amino acid transporter
MTRWIAPLVAGLSLLVLLAGLFRAETETATTAGVSLVFWGVAGLVLAGAGAGLAELSAARHLPAPRTPAGRAPAARRPRTPRAG